VQVIFLGVDFRDALPLYVAYAFEETSAGSDDV